MTTISNEFLASESSPKTEWRHLKETGTFRVPTNTQIHRDKSKNYHKLMFFFSLVQLFTINSSLANINVNWKPYFATNTEDIINVKPNP